MKPWSVYLLRNERGALYTGISNAPERRLAEHRSGLSRGAKYTRGCKSLELVYCCEVGSRGTALKIESRIKRWRKVRKETLVETCPDLQGLLNFPGLLCLDLKAREPGK